MQFTQRPQVRLLSLCAILFDTFSKIVIEFEEKVMNTEKMRKCFSFMFRHEI